MAARNIAEIISLDSHARTVRLGQHGPATKHLHAEQQPDPDRLREAAGIINKLFAELQACFPAWKHSFSSQQDIAAAKRSWARGLIEAGISSEQQLRWGLRKARRSESPFWPSVGQFIKWCQPDPGDYGLPTPESAFKEASRNSHPACICNKWSHPAVYVAAREAGKYELANLPQDKSWPLFKRSYDIAVRRVLEGEELDGEIPKALPKTPEPRPVAPEIAQQHIDRIKQMLKRGS
ncbi:replication protein P [Idiomarina loihiensis]|uniref:replication protein P n=1 Tax=Idiomarina loihiensis TaxID=135577 RepID=UPI0039BDC4DC